MAEVCLQAVEMVKAPGLAISTESVDERDDDGISLNLCQ